MNNYTDEINYLASKIERHQQKYYDGDPEISDNEFDILWDRLTKLCPEHPILHKVGKDSSSVFLKVEHLMHMNSQEKCRNAEEFRNRARKQRCGEFLVQNKCDGSSIELQYNNGKFTKAVTRGNGVIGDDVTCNIIKSKGLVKILKDHSFTGAVRGEVLLFHEDFNKYFKDKANCRNAANGIMKRKNSEDADKLTIVVYDVFRSLGKPFETENSKYLWLVNNEFYVVDTNTYTDIE